MDQRYLKAVVGLRVELAYQTKLIDNDSGEIVFFCLRNLFRRLIFFGYSTLNYKIRHSLNADSCLFSVAGQIQLLVCLSDRSAFY